MIEISIITARVVETALGQAIKATISEKCKLERDGETLGAELAGGSTDIFTNGIKRN